MTEYSYSDLVKMQDQAIRRVREMQERARLTVKENPIPPLDNSTSFDNLPSGERVHSNTDSERTKDLPSGERVRNGSDLERSKILLPLIMLLSREGADNILMIALLYILA